MKYQNPDIESSYRENDIGKTFYDLVLHHKPKKIVEIGILHGYSTIAMAMALDELGEGHIFAYDLFEDYPYKHGSIEGVMKNLKRYGVEKYVTLTKKNFDQWIAQPEPFDLLHVDISNNGDIIEKLYAAVKKDIERGAIVIFEGGSEERDQVEWMSKYNKRAMRGIAVPYELINPSFPSLSMIKKTS